jgi:hypothetical protein
MDRINVHAPSEAHAQRLLGAVDGRFSANLNGGDSAPVVELRLDEETATQLVDLFRPKPLRRSQLRRERTCRWRSRQAGVLKGDDGVLVVAPARAFRPHGVPSRQSPAETWEHDVEPRRTDLVDAP